MGGSRMGKQRRDAERRMRQYERFARLLRITRLLLGHGRWGPDDLAKEICCSPRTIYRDIQTLGMAGIPIYFNKECQAYQVPEGFKFPGLETKTSPLSVSGDQLRSLIDRTKKFVADGQELIRQLEDVCKHFDSSGPG